ncbi:MAG: glycosyltransferase family 1 protein [Actinomycetota bacterium]
MNRAGPESDKLRVLIAAETFLPSVNGVTNSVLRVIEHLRLRGHEAMVMAPNPGPSFVDNTPVVRVPSQEFPMYRNLPVGFPTSKMIDKIVDEFQPDVIHLAAPAVLGARVAAAASARDLPVVAIYQTDLPGFAKSYGLSVLSPALWWWLRRVHRMADVTLAPSTAAAKDLHAQGVTRVGVWGRGVDRELFRPGRFSPEFRREVVGDHHDNAVLVGYVGRLAREKGIDRLRWLQRIPDVKLVIVGDGPQADELKQLLPKAHFTGMLRGIGLATAMASLDVFVHTGTHETFGQTIQEAMASGLPVVAPASGGPLDLVVPDETGYLYEPDSDTAMVSAVNKLVSDPDRRRQFGAAGRIRTEERGWDRLGDELIETYHRCIELRVSMTDSRRSTRPTRVSPLARLGI